MHAYLKINGVNCVKQTNLVCASHCSVIQFLISRFLNLALWRGQQEPCSLARVLLKKQEVNQYRTFSMIMLLIQKEMLTFARTVAVICVDGVVSVGGENVLFWAGIHWTGHCTNQKKWKTVYELTLEKVKNSSTQAHFGIFCLQTNQERLVGHSSRTNVLVIRFQAT